MPLIPCPIAQWAREYPEGIALVTPDKELTYAQLDQSISQWCSIFEKKEIKEGEVIALALPTSIETVEILWALFRVGAIAFMLNPHFPEQTLRRYALEAGAKTLISITDIDSLAQEKTGFSTTFYSLALKQWATYLLTSGTSGKPKIAVHTLANYYYNALGATTEIPLLVTDRWFLSLPLYHVGGLGILFRVFLSGAAIVMTPKAPLETTISRFNITHASWVPTQLYRALKTPGFSYEPFSTLKAILIGGAPLNDSLALKGYEVGFPLYPTYGLTEMTSQVTVAKPGALHVGHPLGYRNLQITNTSEIWVKGHTLFQGYLDQGLCTLPLNEEGWFFTGDLGQTDAEGNLHIQGRQDQLFISGGENIQPEEIEAALLEIDSICQAMVLPIEDPEFGKRPIAYVQTLNSDSWTPALFIEKLKETLPAYKIPIAIHPWPETPLGGIKPSRAEMIL